MDRKVHLLELNSLPETGFPFYWIEQKSGGRGRTTMVYPESIPDRSGI